MMKNHSIQPILKLGFLQGPAKFELTGNRQVVFELDLCLNLVSISSVDLHEEVLRWTHDLLAPELAPESGLSIAIGASLLHLRIIQVVSYRILDRNGSFVVSERAAKC